MLLRAVGSELFLQAEVAREDMALLLPTAGTLCLNTAGRKLLSAGTPAGLESRAKLKKVKNEDEVASGRDTGTQDKRQGPRKCHASVTPGGAKCGGTHDHFARPALPRRHSLLLLSQGRPQGLRVPEEGPGASALIESWGVGQAARTFGFRILLIPCTRTRGCTESRISSLARGERRPAKVLQ